MARVLKYQQIEGFLREELSSGKFQPEERFYSENEIAARFGVTQLTARKAFVALENAGFLKRKRGLGTFVARPPRTPERLALFRRCIVGVILPERLRRRSRSIRNDEDGEKRHRDDEKETTHPLHSEILLNLGPGSIYPASRRLQPSPSGFSFDFSKKSTQIGYFTPQMQNFF